VIGFNAVAVRIQDENKYFQAQAEGADNDIRPRTCKQYNVE